MIDDNATGRPRPIATDRNATDRRQPAAAPTAHQEPACWQADELTALYRHAPIGLAVLDRDLRFIRINDSLGGDQRLFGRGAYRPGRLGYRSRSARGGRAVASPGL